MPFDTPTPRAVLFWCSKNREEITLRIAHRAFAFFHVTQDLFEAHDCVCLEVPTMAQAGTQERIGQRTLFAGHFLDRKTLSLLRDEVPVQPFIALEFKH